MSVLKPTSIAAILFAAFVGCAIVETGDHVWFKEGATPQQQDAALVAARVQAEQANGAPAERRDMVIRSMTAQGWRLVAKDSAPRLKSDATRKTAPSKQTGTVLQ